MCDILPQCWFSSFYTNFKKNLKGVEFRLTASSSIIILMKLKKNKSWNSVHIRKVYYQIHSHELSAISYCYLPVISHTCTMYTMKELLWNVHVSCFRIKCFLWFYIYYASKQSRCTDKFNKRNMKICLHIHFMVFKFHN